MFFYPSKLFWLLAAPTNALALAALLGLMLCFTRFARAGRWLGLAAALGLVTIGAGPVSNWLMRPLEDRFPRPELTGGITGMIVLGGAIGTSRGEVVMNDSAARMTVSAALAYRFPEAKIVFTGGDASLFADEPGIEAATEAEAARRFYTSVGIDPARLILEGQSRNTRENATMTKPLLGQKPGERWLLITSAWHMPRSVGVFRRAGIEVIPYPVSYVTRGDAADWRRVNGDFSNGFKYTNQAVKEWIGLIAYWAAGYTDALLPGP